MSEKKRFFDVWIVQGNRVYKEVPHAVVIDWTQQGRLVAEDMLRPSGTAEWYRLGSINAFQAFLPRPEPQRVEDTAEALEPVEFEFTYRRRGEDEDDDVDMIPLIDISLVLLVFFMMTTTVAVSSMKVNVPLAAWGAELQGRSDVLQIAIIKADEGYRYSLAEGGQPPPDDSRNLDVNTLLGQFDDRLNTAGEALHVRIAADQDIPYETVEAVAAALEVRRRKGRTIASVTAEVDEQP